MKTKLILILVGVLAVLPCGAVTADQILIALQAGLSEPPGGMSNLVRDASGQTVAFEGHGARIAVPGFDPQQKGLTTNPVIELAVNPAKPIVGFGTSAATAIPVKPDAGAVPPPLPPGLKASLVVVTNAPPTNGIVGRPLGPTNEVISWNDAKQSNATVASYNIYCSTASNLLYQGTPIKATNWTQTNGVDYFTLTNILPFRIYYADMIAMTSNGSPVMLVNGPPTYQSTMIAFMAEKGLLPGFDGTNFNLTFFGTSNHSYTIQWRKGTQGTNAWTSLPALSNFQGVITWTDTNGVKGSGKLYRLLIK